MQLPYDVVLFDLDGTLTRSHPGITRCAKYALEQMGRDVSGLDLTIFVGPPLYETFRTLGLTDAEAREAIARLKAAPGQIAEAARNGATLVTFPEAYISSFPVWCGVWAPVDTHEFAINSSNSRFWEPPIKRYVDECLAGKDGPRGKDFNMRWIASMVADVHRILTRGGVFLYPWDKREPEKPGKLRLMYEANPMGWIVEQAGGAATNCRQRILDIQPGKLHERVSVVLGSKNEVDRITRYHTESQ